MAALNHFDAKKLALVRLIKQLIAFATELRRWIGLPRRLQIFTRTHSRDKYEAPRAKVDLNFRSEPQEVFRADVSKLELLA